MKQFQTFFQNGFAAKMLLVVLAVFFSQNAFAEGDPTVDWEQAIASQTINGHYVELVKYNWVYSANSSPGCCDIHGCYTDYRSKQGQRLKIDGIVVSESPQYEQRKNFEHCIKTGGEWNHEHWSSIVQSFYQEGDQIRVRMRNYGGKCYDPFVYPQDCDDEYDETIVLSASYPTAGQCTPGPGNPCCRWDETFYGTNQACQTNIPQTENCGCGGTRTRYITKYCSGTSATCNGSEVPGPWGECVGGTNPVPEICGNGADDDCDGQTDEGENPCMNWVFCQPYSYCGQCPIGHETWREPPREICNGRDDDCDGIVDEQEAVPPYKAGDSCIDMYGSCSRSGTLVCDAHQQLVCSASIVLQEEVCDDGMDNDCDGCVDCGDCIGCPEGGTKPCGATDRGACTFGTATCINQRWVCNAVPPQPESGLCDGIDSDCDGALEEAWFPGRPCQESNQAVCEFIGGTWMGAVCCGNDRIEAPNPQTQTYGVEVCDDPTNLQIRKDNDCDGLIDEGHVCPVVCKDGTKEGQCSDAKPNKCVYTGSDYYGEYQMKCQECGCPVGLTCGSDGTCRTAFDNSPPAIQSLSFDPTIVVFNQDVYFNVQLWDSSNILSVELFFKRFDHPPSADEINNSGSWSPVSVVLFDDGMHNDGAAWDQEYGGTLADGFSEPGYYAFRVQARDVLYNADAQNFFLPFHVLSIGETCTILEQNGDITQKMNIFFVGHASNGGPNGFDSSETMDFQQWGFDALFAFKQLPHIQGNFENKFNFFRVDSFVDLGCHCEPFDRGFGTECQIECDNPTALFNAALLCTGGYFKDTGGASSDKAVAVFDDDDPEGSVGWTSNAGLSANWLRVAASSHERTFSHELGHLWGLMDYYFYTNTALQSILVDCFADPKRDCIMCDHWQQDSFACPMNNRVSCKMRDDVPDERGQYCNDGFSSDADYLSDLLGGIP